MASSFLAPPWALMALLMMARDSPSSPWPYRPQARHRHTPHASSPIFRMTDLRRGTQGQRAVPRRRGDSAQTGALYEGYSFVRWDYCVRPDSVGYVRGFWGGGWSSAFRAWGRRR